MTHSVVYSIVVCFSRGNGAGSGVSPGRVHKRVCRGKGALRCIDERNLCTESENKVLFNSKINVQRIKGLYPSKRNPPTILRLFLSPYAPPPFSTRKTIVTLAHYTLSTCNVPKNYSNIQPPLFFHTRPSQAQVPLD